MFLHLPAAGAAPGSVFCKSEDSFIGLSAQPPHHARAADHPQAKAVKLGNTAYAVPVSFVSPLESLPLFIFQRLLTAAFCIFIQSLVNSERIGLLEAHSY